MSRIGNQPIKIPDNVEVEVEETQVVVSGPYGKVVVQLRPELGVNVKDSLVTVERLSPSRFARALHGTIRAVIANAIVGVTEGHEKRLVLEGLGYRTKKQGDKLEVEVGFSHPVHFEIPESLEVAVEGNSEIIVRGADKAQVGKFAAEVRAARPPEPYKGKGIRYKGEEVKKKPGKAAKMGEGFGA